MTDLEDSASGPLLTILKLQLLNARVVTVAGATERPVNAKSAWPVGVPIREAVRSWLLPLFGSIRVEGAACLALAKTYQSVPTAAAGIVM